MAERREINIGSYDIPHYFRMRPDPNIEISGELVRFTDSDIFFPTDNVDFNFNPLRINLLVFEGCRFLNGAGKLANLNVRGDSKERILVLKGSEFGSLHINNCTSSISECISDEIHIGDSHIEHFQTNKAKNAYISTSDFLNDADIQIATNQLHITQSNFHGKFAIENSTIQNLKLSKVDSKPKDEFIKITDSAIQTAELKEVNCHKLSYNRIAGESAHFEGCNFGNFTAFQSDHSLTFTNNTLTGSVKSCKGQNLEFKKNTISSLDLISNSFEESKTMEQEVDSFKIEGNKGKLAMSGFGDVKTSKFPSLLNNEYELIDLNSWHFEDFHQVAEKTKIERLIFSGAKCKNSIRISTSGLKYLEFEFCDTNQIDLNLSGISNLKFFKSNALDVSISGEIDTVIFFNDNSLKNDIRNLDFINLTSKKLSLADSKFETLSFSNLKSENLEVLNDEYKTLIISNNEIDSLSFGSSNKEESGWFFQNSQDAIIVVDQNPFIKTLIISDSNNPKVIPTEFHIKNNDILNIQITYSGSRVKVKCAKNICQDIQLGSKNQANNYGEISFLSDTITTLSCWNFNGSLTAINSKLSRSQIVKSFGSFKFEICTPLDDKFDNKLSIEESRIDNLNIISCNFYELFFTKLDIENLQINGLDVNRLELYEFYNSGVELGNGNQLRFINKAANYHAKSLSIQYSDLGALQLNSCFLSSFEELNVKESKLSKITCTSTTWPSTVTSYSDGRMDYFEIREACRQLKIAMANHQDRVSELQFHALEMNAYRHTIRSKKSEKKLLERVRQFRKTPLRVRIKRANDRISLWAGWTNDFGLNWFKPLFFLLIPFNTLLYWITLKMHFSDSWLGYPFSCGNWLDFLSLFNPVHKTTEIYQGTISGGIAVLDFFGRIITAFFLYQIVTAFRKYRK